MGAMRDAERATPDREGRSRRPERGRRACRSAALSVAAVLVAGVCAGAAIPGFFSEPLGNPSETFVGLQTRTPFNQILCSDETGSIVRVASNGEIVATPVPGGDGTPWVPSGIAFGPDGALWFLLGKTVGGVEETRMARWAAPHPEAELVTFPLPTPGGGGGPAIVGPDGYIWYTQPRAAKVGRMSLAGTATELAMPGGSWPNDLAAGSDGRVWVVLENTGRIVRIDSPGAVESFELPRVSATRPTPARIIGGPGGNLYFTDPATNSVWSMTTAGAATRFPIPTMASDPYGLAAAPGGNFVYFTERTPDAIARLDVTNGSIAESAMAAVAERQFPHEITLAFPFPAPQPFDTFVVNSPLLFRATAPAAAVPHGPALSLRLSVDDGEGGSPGSRPLPGVAFRYVATVENDGDAPSDSSLLVSIVLPDRVALVSSDGCALSGDSTLLCPARGAIAPGGQGAFSCLLRLRDGAAPAVGVQAFLFGGGDPANPRAAALAFGRATRPVEGGAPQPVSARR